MLCQLHTMRALCHAQPCVALCQPYLVGRYVMEDYVVRVGEDYVMEDYVCPVYCTPHAACCTLHTAHHTPNPTSCIQRATSSTRGAAWAGALCTHYTLPCKCHGKSVMSQKVLTSAVRYATITPWTKSPQGATNGNAPRTLRIE